jgi:zinc-ribbon domain
MFCPQCATANSPDVKFCRSCGAGLEAVALALSNPTKKKLDRNTSDPATAQDLLERRIKGVSSITRGSILMAVSFLLTAPFYLFLPPTFDAPWILIWVVFFGWMTVWGGIEAANGISAVLESKSRLRQLGLTGKETVVEARQHDALMAGQSSPANDQRPGLAPRPRVSVTEGTTRQLND